MKKKIAWNSFRSYPFAIFQHKKCIYFSSQNKKMMMTMMKKKQQKAKWLNVENWKNVDCSLVSGIFCLQHFKQRATCSTNKKWKKLQIRIKITKDLQKTMFLPFDEIPLWESIFCFRKSEIICNWYGIYVDRQFQFFFFSRSTYRQATRRKKKNYYFSYH